MPFFYTERQSWLPWWWAIPIVPRSLCDCEQQLLCPYQRPKEWNKFGQMCPQNSVSTSRPLPTWSIDLTKNPWWFAGSNLGVKGERDDRHNYTSKGTLCDFGSDISIYSPPLDLWYTHGPAGQSLTIGECRNFEVIKHIFDHYISLTPSWAIGKSWLLF